jgi:hypothetical protein
MAVETDRIADLLTPLSDFAGPTFPGGGPIFIELRLGDFSNKKVQLSLDVILEFGSHIRRLVFSGGKIQPHGPFLHGSISFLIPQADRRPLPLQSSSAGYERGVSSEGH